MSSSFLLSVEHLHLAFGEQEVVRDVSFRIEKGMRMGMVGESGSGKSLTALAIMGLLPGKARIARGAVRWQQDGQVRALHEQGASEWIGFRGRRIGMIFQEPMSSLNPVMPCGKQIEETIRRHHGSSRPEARERTMFWMEKVGLDDLQRMYRSYPHQLSGGQKQRIMIAMALCGDPELLIADEPTTALDLRIQQQILRLLHDLSADMGLSLLFISHDLGVVQQVADEVVVLEQGEKVEAGPVSQVFDHPQTPYTQGLLACRPPLRHKLHRLPTIEQIRTGGFQAPRITPTKDKAADTTVPLLEAKQLSVHFTEPKNWLRAPGGVRAVDQVDLQLFPGETLGLVGESGSGKTTLGRCLIGLQDPTRGERFFRGQLLTDRRLKDGSCRRSLQMIFQDPYSALNPRMTVGEAIMEPMRWQQRRTAGAIRDQAIHLLEQVGLSAEHLNRYPRAFSGGQRQRICIARALAAEPDVIVCDESVSALDVSVQAQVLNLLKDLQEKHQLTYLFISHDLGVIRFMSDRVVVMKNGRIVETGDADAIFAAPQAAYTHQLMEAVPNGKKK